MAKHQQRLAAVRIGLRAVGEDLRLLDQRFDEASVLTRAVDRLIIGGALDVDIDEMPVVYVFTFIREFEIVGPARSPGERFLAEQPLNFGQRRLL
jgi:hypothetical protein